MNRAGLISKAEDLADQVKDSITLTDYYLVLLLNPIDSFKINPNLNLVLSQ